MIDQPGRLALAQDVQRGGHGGPGGQAVVHHDDDAPGHLQRRAYRRVLRAPLVDQLQLPALFGGDVMRIGARRCGVRRQVGPAALIDRADGVFGLVGRAQLAHQHQVQLSLQRLGDALRHGHGAARNGQHQGVLAGIGL